MEFKLEQLTLEEVNIILDTLSELPYKVSFNLISKVQHQANKQLSESKKNKMEEIENES